MSPIEAAFTKFKNKYFSAVQTDTALGLCDNDDDRYLQLERKAKLFWDQSNAAEAEFRELLKQLLGGF